MNKRKTAFLLAFCLAAAGCLTGLGNSSVYGAEQEVQFTGEYADNELLVVFQEDVTKQDAEEIADQQKAEDMTVINTPQEEVTGLVELPKGQTVEQAAAQYEADPDIAYVQPNYIYKLAGDGSSSSPADEVNAGASPKAAEINDTRAKDLWHLDMIQAQEAWELMEAIPHKKVRVAVLDTGANLAHEDLQANVNKSLCIDLSYGTPRLFKGDDDGHGTHVTGILAATANNSLGVAGTAAGTDNSIAEVFVADVFARDAKGELGASTAAMVAGIQYAAEKEAKVINMSLGYEAGAALDYEDRLLESAINKADAAGITIVAAAGNGSDDRPGIGNTRTNYPADFDACISVISVTSNKQRSGFSNYGKDKDLSAPGTEILSTGRTGGYQTLSGTSMATPVVSAAAALLYSIDSNMTSEEVKGVLYSSAEDIYTPGWDEQSGHGIVNTYEAVAMAQEYMTSIKLNKTSLSMKPGQTAKLEAVFGGQGKQDPVWTSSNPSVADVDPEGTVTAKTYGTAVITIKSSDALGVSAACKVTVPYTITYNLNGGKNNSKNPAAYYGKTITLKNPTRAGYTFAGWYRDKGFTSKISSFSSGNQTLYAKWKKVTVGKESIKKLKQASSSKAVLTYKKISGAKYQTAYSTSKKFAKSKTKYKASKSTSVKLTGLKKGKTYYVKVRAYKSDSAGKKVYGTYSSIKKIKLK